MKAILPATLSRRHALAGFAALSVAGPRIARARELEKITFQQSWLSGVQYAGLYLAKDKGYFAEEGLDVEFVPGGPNIDGTLNVVTGKAVLGDRPTDILITARGKGMPLKVIGSMFQRSPMCVMSLAETPITSLKDMIGKTIAVAGTTRPIYVTLVKQAGLDPAAVNWVPVSPDPGALSSKQVDGFTGLDTNQGSILRSRGVKIHSLLLGDVGYRIYTGAIYTTEKVLQSRRPQMVGFLRAAIKGHRDMLGDPDGAARLTVEKFAAPGMDINAALTEARASIDYIDDRGAMRDRLLWVTPAAIEKEIAIHAANGAIASIYPASDLIEQKPISEALGRAS